jgi:hypothetical protein
VFDTGEYKGTGSLGSSSVTDNLVAGTKDYYGFLVINDGDLLLRGGAADGATAVTVTDLLEDDIPICLIQVLVGSSAGARKLQYYGMKKRTSSLSVGEEVSNQYKERLKIDVNGNAPRLIVNTNGTDATWTFGTTGGTIARSQDAITSDERTKLSGIDTGAKDDQTAAEIKSLYESNAETNAITDAVWSSLAPVSIPDNLVLSSEVIASCDLAIVPPVVPKVHVASVPFVLTINLGAFPFTSILSRSLYWLLTSSPTDKDEVLFFIP